MSKKNSFINVIKTNCDVMFRRVELLNAQRHNVDKLPSNWTVG
jgi:hypothetical protein